MLEQIHLTFFLHTCNQTIMLVCGALSAATTATTAHLRKSDEGSSVVSLYIKVKALSTSPHFS